VELLQALACAVKVDDAARARVSRTSEMWNFIVAPDFCADFADIKMVDEKLVFMRPPLGRLNLSVFRVIGNPRSLVAKLAESDVSIDESRARGRRALTIDVACRGVGFDKLRRRRGLKYGPALSLCQPDSKPYGGSLTLTDG
jgi:hypothetical protein